MEGFSHAASRRLATGSKNGRGAAIIKEETFIRKIVIRRNRNEVRE